MERVRGRVIGEGVQLRFAKLTIEDRVISRGLEPATFALALDDGSEARVETGAPKLGPTVVERGRWSQLADHPFAELFEDVAPGPHVKVTLEGVVVRGGDSVVLEGQVDRKPKAEGYRGSEEAVIAAIRPLRIGVGEGADDWLDEGADERRELPEAEEKSAAEPPPSDPSGLPVLWPTVGLALGTVAAGTGLGAGLLGLGFHVTRFILFGLGLQLMIASVFVLAWRRPLPWMKTVGRRDSGRGLPWSAGGTLPALFLGACVVLFAAIGVAMEAASYAVGATMAVGASGWILGGVLFARRRSDARALRLLLGAKAERGEGWGLREGRLESGRLEWERTHEQHSSTRTETYTDSEGRSQTRQVTSVWYDFDERVDAEPLVLETGGERLAIEPKGASWGTTEVEVDDALKLLARARPGHSVAAVGRVQAGAMRKAGPESLFLFSTGEGSAAEAARRSLWMHRLAVGALLLLGALGVVAGWINPAQNHRRIEGVVEASYDPAIEAGDRCVLDLGWLQGRPYATLPHRCQVRASCDGKLVYGGWSPMGKGYFDCDAEALRGSDAGPDDEDGLIELRGDRASADHGDGRVLFHFDR